MSEDEWKTKFKNSEDLYYLKENSKTRMIAYYEKMQLEGKEAKLVDIYREIFKDGFDLPELPIENGELSFDKQQKFLKDKLDFNPNNFSILSAKTENELQKALKTVEKLLRSGKSVPISLGIDWTKISGNVFGAKQAENIPTAELEPSLYLRSSGVVSPSQGNFKLTGGHAMLITELKSSTNLDENLGRPLKLSLADQFDKLVVKNSWGTTENEFGKKLEYSGYYEITYEYITASFEDRAVYFVVAK